MNGPIRKVSVLVMVMFLALMVNMSYSYVFRTESLRSDPNNRRVRDAEFGTDRGDILVGNTPVATSSAVNDRYQFQRKYPQGTLYAPVTGYFSFMYGSSALEQSQNQALTGQSDAQFLQRMVDTATGKTRSARPCKPPWTPARSAPPTPPSATGPGPSSPWTTPPARCSPWSPRPATTRTSSRVTT